MTRCLLLSGWAVGGLIAPLVAASLALAAPIQDPLPSELQALRIVKRDLMVVAIEGTVKVSPDGVTLGGSEVVAWKNIIGVESEEDSEVWQLANQRYGEPWFLLQSRWRRGESLQLDALATQLLESYQSDPGRRCYGQQELLRWRVNQTLQSDYALALQVFDQWREQNKNDNATPGESSEQWRATYQLVSPWSVDSSTGLCLQVSPPSTPAAAAEFLDSQNERTEVREVTRLHQLLATVMLPDRDPGSAWAEWSKVASVGPTLRSLLESARKTELPDWRDWQETVAQWEEIEKQNGTELSWAEQTLVYWIWGNRLLARSDRRSWTQGALLLMRLSYLHEQMQSEGEEPSAWVALAKQRVIDKYLEVGEPGKVAALRRR